MTNSLHLNSALSAVDLHCLPDITILGPQALIRLKSLRFRLKWVLNRIGVGGGH